MTKSEACKNFKRLRGRRKRSFRNVQKRGYWFVLAHQLGATFHEITGHHLK